MVEFRRKEVVTNFGELSAVFADLYDGTGGLNYGRTFKVNDSSAAQDNYGFSSLKGGPNTTKAFFRTKVAPRPVYGSSELKRMDAFIFIEDVLLDEETSITPNFNFFKAKQDVVPESLTTGNVRLRDNTTRGFGHITAMAAHMDGYISDSEAFTGEENQHSYSATSYFRGVGQTVEKLQGGLWLEASDAWSHGYSAKDDKKYKDREWPYYHRHKSSFMGAFGETLTPTGGGESRKVVFIENRDYTSSSAVEGLKSGLWTGRKKAAGGQRVLFKDGDIKNLIQSTITTPITTDSTYANQINTTNTFFDVVKQDREMMIDPSSRDPLLIGTCLSRFSTDNLLHNDGQSMEMFAYWEGDNRVDDSEDPMGILVQIQKMKQLYKPYINPNPTDYVNTQETFVSYGPVPFAAHMFPGFYGKTTIDAATSVNTHISNNEISKGTESVKPVVGSQIVFDDSGGWDTTGIEPNTIYYVSETAPTGTAATWFKLTTDPKGTASGNITLGGTADTDLKTFSSGYTGVTSDYGGHSNGTIEIDINFKNLDTAVAYGSGASEKFSLVKRAFVVTFGFHKPSTGDNLMSYIEKHTPSVSNAASIIGTNTHAPLLAWSFFRTKSSAQDWADGVHVVDISKWLMNTDFDGSNHKDFYILETSDTDEKGSPIVDRGVIPSGEYVTFKIHCSPCTGLYGDSFEYSICDPTTGIPLPYQSSTMDYNNYDPVDSDTHMAGAEWITDAWWTGRTGADSGGLDFWTKGTGGGVDYFEAGVENQMDGGGPSGLNAVWPRYLTMWLVNYPNSSSTGSSDNMLEQDGGEQSVTINSETEYVRRPTTSSVFIDGIRFKNFNFRHDNATLPSKGSKHSGLTIPTSISSHGNYYSPPFFGSHPNLPGSTTLCFGTDEYNDFMDATEAGGILLSDFRTDLSNNQSLPYHNIRASMSTDYNSDYYATSGTIFTDIVTNTTTSTGGESFFGNQARTSHIGGGAANNVQHDSCFLLDVDSTLANALVYDTGTGSVDSFTNKGYIKIQGNIESASDVKDGISTNTPDLTKRELIYTSARVLRAAHSDKSILKVDTVVPFYGHEGDNLIAYLYGSAFRETDHDGVGTINTNGGDANTCNTTVKLIEIIDSKHIRVEWNGKSNNGYNMTSDYQLPYLMMSPLKYWIFINIDNYNLSPSRGAGNYTGASITFPIEHYPSRSYNSAILTRSHAAGDSTVHQHYGTFGMTYNEYLYKDAPTITGSYENAWNHSRLDPEGILDLEDWGFGDFDKDTNEGGFLSKDIPKINQYNISKFYDIFNVDGELEPEDSIEFMLLSDNSSKHEMIYHNNLTGSGAGADVDALHTKRLPYFVTVFEDELPVSPTLTTKPFEQDPFYPEFIWSDADEDDLWYGLLIIDDKPINSQYHGGILHLPLNDKGDNLATNTNNVAQKLWKYNSDAGSTSETALTASSSATYDMEGLAGNCLRFDGVNDLVTYTPSSGNTFTDITNAFTFIVHIIPDIDISGATNTIFTSNPLNVNFNASTSQIEVKVYESSGKYVDLYSNAITVDGETPTCVIVTLDGDITNGNVKLYIDGKLDDQSGLIQAGALDSGANNSWGVNDTAYISTTFASVGSGSNSFDGRIEEVVLYNKTLYPVVPSSGSFVLTKPLVETRKGKPISYSARLFIKDYHNIRGSTTTEIATSASVSWKKAAFRIGD